MAKNAASKYGVGEMTGRIDRFQAYAANAPRTDDEIAMAMAVKIQQWRKSGVRFAVECLGLKPWKKQRAILNDMSKPGAKVSAKSGHGTGKSFTLAIEIWRQLICWDHSTVVCTAPTAHQLYDVLWAEIARLHKRLPPSIAARFKVINDEVYCIDSPKTWKATAQTARADAPEGLQGFHNAEPDRLLVVVDEGSGVPDKIYEVLEGALTHTHARAIIMGNPTKREGYFYDTHEKFNDFWKCHTLSSAEAPARLVDPAYPERIARRYGRNSNVYRVRVLGEFPRSEADTVVPIEWVENALARDLPKDFFRHSEYRMTLHLDVAKFGGDDCVLTARQGRAILGMWQWHGQDEVASVANVLQIARRIYQYSPEYMQDGRLARPAYYPDVFVDYLGIGAEVCKLLRAYDFIACMPVNVGLDARSDHVMRVRDELWWSARLFFQNDNPLFAPIPADGQGAKATLEGWNPHRPFISRELLERLANEISTPKYKILDGGKIKVEGKEEMRKRLNIAEDESWSPDAADSLNLSFFMQPVLKDNITYRHSWEADPEATDIMGV